jgi:hypothetical protein
MRKDRYQWLLNKMIFNFTTTLLFEDEGSNIGALHIPDCIQAKTKQAELIQ